jgi:chemotaxis response regulator CheB
MVVDDYPVMRAGVSSIVNTRSDMTVVAQPGSGEEAVSLFAGYKPDIMLMDLRLPGMSGVDAISAIRPAPGCEICGSHHLGRRRRHRPRPRGGRVRLHHQRNALSDVD